VRIGVVVRVVLDHRVEHGARLLRRRGRVEIVQVGAAGEQREIRAIDFHAPSPGGGSGPSRSVDTSLSLDASAECSACHARLAHFTRNGNLDTPPSARSEPRSPCSDSGSSPITSLWKRSNNFSASARLFPLTAAVISDADALEIAQPWPLKLTSAIAS